MNKNPTSLRIIHVALFTRNPHDLAPFYRDAFGMKIVHVGGAVQLWDGHILLALNPWRGVGEEKLRIDEVGEPQAKGFDHFGFKIEDLEETKGLLKRAGCDTEVMKRPAEEHLPSGGPTIWKVTESISLKEATSRFLSRNYSRSKSMLLQR